MAGYQGNDEQVKHDQWVKDRFGITDHDYQAYRAQRNNANRRKIPFDFSLLGWCSWWRKELKRIGESATRGRRRHQFAMCRFNDSGAYEPGNVYAGRPADNARDVPKHRRADAVIKAKKTREVTGNPLGSHLKVRGDGHPRSIAVVTPLGRFGSIALASEAHGITRQGGHYAVRAGRWAVEAPP